MIPMEKQLPLLSYGRMDREKTGNLQAGRAVGSVGPEPREVLHALP